MSSRRRLSSAEEQKFRRSYWRDPRQFIERYLKIQPKDATRGLVLLALNEAQRIVYKKIQELRAAGKPVRLVILKARQMGISTFIEGFLFAMARLNMDTNCLIVSHSKDSAKRIYKMAQLFLDNIPNEIRPLVASRTQSLTEFANPDETTREREPGLRSQIQIATAKNVDVGASFTFHGVHASEVARWNAPEDTMLSIMNSVPDHPNTFVAVESTAQGMGGYFYDLWQRAVSGKSEWTPIFLPWWIFREYELEISVAERQQILDTLTDDERWLLKEFSPAMTLEKLAWRRLTIDVKCEGKVSLFRQEYPSTAEEAFLASGTMVFEPEAIKYHLQFARDGRQGRLVRDQRSRRIHFVADKSGPLTVWKPPRKGEDYVVSGDPSQGMVKRKDGKEGDYAAACILSNHMEQVAEFQAHLEPHEFADYLDMIGRWYNTALVYPEVSGYGGGYSVQYALQFTHRYPRLGTMPQYDQVGARQTEHVGFNPNGASVPILISKLVREVHRSAGLLLPSELMDKVEESKPVEHRISHSQRERMKRNCKLRIYSRKLCSEMTSYIVRDNGDIGAAGDGKDDLVRALGLAILALEQIPPPNESDPLMKTLAKMPAVDYNERGVPHSIMGNSNFPDWI